MDPERLPRRDSVNSIERLVRLLVSGVIGLDEFSSNWLAMTVSSAEADWLECLAAVPESLQEDLLGSARSHLLDVDFMPSPGVVCPSANSPEVIEAAKQKLRPRYVKLLEVLQDSRKASGTGADRDT